MICETSSSIARVKKKKKQTNKQTNKPTNKQTSKLFGHIALACKHRIQYLQKETQPLTAKPIASCS